MAFDVLSFIIGQKAAKSGGSSGKKIILAEQTFEGFAYNAEFGSYIYDFGANAPFSLTQNETYIIQWDGTEYECVAQNMDVLAEGSVLAGNLSPFGGNGNNETFLIGYLPSTAGGVFCSFEASDSHKVGIYQKAESGGDSSGGVVNGVDPYYQKLAETMVKRDASYLSGDAATMSLKGFVTSNGSTLGNVQEYTYAGFDDLVSIELSDTVIVSENAFAGDEKLKIIDITVPDVEQLAQTVFMEGSLNGCTALESVIIRPSTIGLTGASINANHGSNDTFYIYVPAEYYETVIAGISGNILPASRYRKLEDYPEVDNWKGE